MNKDYKPPKDIGPTVFAILLWIAILITIPFGVIYLACDKVRNAPYSSSK